MQVIVTRVRKNTPHCLPFLKKHGMGSKLLTKTPVIKYAWQKKLIMVISQNALTYCSYIYLHFTLFCTLFVNIYKIYLYVAHAWLMNWSYYITPPHIELQWLHSVISWVVVLCQLVGEHQHHERTSRYNLQGQRPFGIPPKVCYHWQDYIIIWCFSDRAS
jgi:hypothetical protein